MRAVTGSIETALAAGTIRPVLAFEAQNNSGYTRLSTFNRDITWNGATFLGNGYLSAISPQTENGELSSSGVQIELTGIPSTLVSLVLGSMTGRLTGRLYLMLLDSSEAVILDPIVMFSGYFDYATIDYAAEGSRITMNYEDESIDFSRTRDYRWTTESQKIFDAADTGFRYVPSLQDWSALWGRPKSEKAKSPPKKKGGKRR